jgi:hypothetical protein
MTDTPDADPVHERVDQVIQDVAAGRVIPRKVDELTTAVDRAKRDQAVHRVTRTSIYRAMITSQQHAEIFRDAIEKAKRKQRP